MKKHTSLLVLLALICGVLSSFSLWADYVFVPPVSYPAIIYRDLSYGRYGDSSGDGVLYLICKSVIDNIDHKKFCCALLGMIVAVWAHSMWPDARLEHNFPNYQK